MDLDPRGGMDIAFGTVRHLGGAQHEAGDIIVLLAPGFAAAWVFWGPFPLASAAATCSPNFLRCAICFYMDQLMLPKTSEVLKLHMGVNRRRGVTLRRRPTSPTNEVNENETENVLEDTADGGQCDGVARGR
jgi:hypothetical protein